MMDSIKATLLTAGVTGDAAARCLATYESDEAHRLLNLTPIDHIIPALPIPMNLFHGEHIEDSRLVAL